MKILKRYGPCLNKNGFATMQKLDNGGWVKFSDIKDLLAKAHNKQSTPCATCGGSGMSVVWNFCPECGRSLTL